MEVIILIILLPLGKTIKFLFREKPPIFKQQGYSNILEAPQICNKILSLASKLINIRWINTGSQPYLNISITGNFQRISK